MISRFSFAIFMVFGSQVLVLGQQVSAPSLQASLQDFLHAENTNLYRGSAIPVFLVKEDTKGTRYLFDHWVKGSVTNMEGAVFSPSQLLYNYDKVGKMLLVLIDSSTVIEISSGEVQHFSLGEGGRSYTFERMKNSSDLNFYQPVVKNAKGYALYKLLTTSLKKANYQTNGLIESGNKYDEYTDQETYYILSPKKELMRINLKEKSIKRALGGELSRVEAYFSHHRKEKINEDFMKGLFRFLDETL